MACPVCHNKGSITCQMKIDDRLAEWSMPCPECTLVRKYLNKICGLKKRTKTSVIPDACESYPDDEDNALTELSDMEVTDEITDTTIEDVLDG